MKIMLDPGHGAGREHNRGFVQIDNLPYCNEGDCNFIYCRDHLKPALEAYGIEVGMTRKKLIDNPSLETRGRMADGYDLLISCHSNAFNGGRATGVEIWDSTNPAESIRGLTNKITAAISRELNIDNRGTKYRKYAGMNYYGILRNGLAKHNFIIEHCFHDNPGDARKYRKNLDGTAKAVAGAIAEFYKLEKIKEEKPECPYQKTHKCPYIKDEEGEDINTPARPQDEAISRFESTSGLDMIITKPGNIYVEHIASTVRATGKPGINGSFYDTPNWRDPNSIWTIAISDGQPIGGNAGFNSYQGIKKGTFIIDTDGKVHVERLANAAQFRGKINFAIGGVELIPDYDPKAEKTAGDILRKTWHTAIGYKESANEIYLIVTNRMCDMIDFKNQLVRLGLTHAVALDGGGSSQMTYKGRGLHQRRNIASIVGLDKVSNGIIGSEWGIDESNSYKPKKKGQQ